MFDYVLSFADQATAQADPVVGKYWNPGNPKANPPIPGAWRGDCVIRGVQVWSPANDVTTPTTFNGQTVNVVTHTFLPGFWLVISKTNRDAALDNIGAPLVLVADRDAANAGAPATTFILFANEAIATLDQMHIQPVFAGSNYPFS